MNKSHVVKVGDRLSLLSIKYYGTPTKPALIIGANPQLIGRPLSLEALPEIYPGDVLNIPEETINIINLPEKKLFPDKIQSTGENAIAFLIDGKILQYFSEYNLTQEIDSFDTIGFSIPFDSDVLFNRSSFNPFGYNDIGIYYDKYLVFGGTMIQSISESRPESKILNVTCYPKCGVLNDCSAPDSLYPIEFENQTLKQISDKLLQPFGLQAVFDGSPGNPFERVAPEPETKIFDFLTDLAKQRGLIITNTPQGNLRFWEADTTSKPVANIIDGNYPFISCSPNFNTQEYYSHITGLLPTTTGKNSEKYTWVNPHLVSLGIVRPHTFIVDDSDTKDLKAAVEKKAGRMFGASCSYSVTIHGHRDANGDIYRKNKQIVLYSPAGMVYNPTIFLIKSVRLSRTSEGGDVTELTLVLPESYTGQIPGVLPWVG